MTGESMKLQRYHLILLIVFFLLSAVSAEQIALGPFGSFIDPPEGWGLIGQEAEKLTFSFPGDSAYLQIKRFPGISGLEALIAEAEGRIAATGEGTRFTYGSGEAYFGTVDFSSGDYDFSGYLFAYFTSDLDPLVLLGFSDREQLGVYNDLILSAMDSYSPLQLTDRLPGPVAAFDRIFSGGRSTAVDLKIGGHQSRIRVDQGEVETASYVTEREARILGAAGSVVAWQRFFRILYRDSVAGLEPLTRALHKLYSRNPSAAETRGIAEDLLAWLQDFTYRRSGTFSDFVDPIRALVTSSGDCDSLGLLYVILLHSFDIDAILLVSEKYGHAMGAVDVPGDGARYAHAGKGYVVAELTDQVDLGLIAADMADPAGWTPVIFPENLTNRTE
jgi:hypothetical protein